ncbi:exodeoxyribonuclease VII small subunit [Azorhizobium sp. AG788]|uniref:exodeoxyribonuclease VII small subunit n=1 Tax=Azorhizobium sp. AG788 TaxID=2183897 RepID=UPI0031399E8F
MAEISKPEGTPTKREAKAPAVSALSFEAALAELEGIVQRLEAGNVPLEESIAIYERGEALKKRCEALLGEAEARVATITRDADGRPTGTAPLDPAG